MGTRIRFKRGAKNKLPKNLAYGEPAFVTDEKELYIGTQSGNVKLTNRKEVESLNNSINKTNENIKNINTELNTKAGKTDVAKISSGTPLFVDSIENMRDITKNYVNTKDGYLYTYNNKSFSKSGIKYQEMGLSDGQVTKKKTSFYKKSKNLENKELQISGKGILTDTGKIYDNNDLTAIETFINIDCEYLSLERFDMDGNSNGSNEEILIAFYTINEQFIKSEKISVNNYIPVPENGVKIRYQIMSNLKGYNFNLYPTKELQGKYIEQYVFEENEKIYKTISDESANIYKIIESLKTGELLHDKSITPDKTNFFALFKNMFNPATVTTGAILKENGIHDSSFDKWKATDWIEVKSGMEIYFSNDGEPFSTHLGALYNTRQEYLSPIQDTTKVTVIEDGYMRVSQDGGFPSKYQIELDNVTSYRDFNDPKLLLKKEYIDIDTKKIYDHMEQYVSKETTEIHESIEDIKTNINSIKNMKKYENKSYLFLGDSITRLDTTDSGWIKYFSEIVKPSKMVNISVNGATWKDYSDTPNYDGNPVPDNHLNVMGNQVQKVINEKTRGNSDYNNFDVIIMAAGTNDPFNRFNETSANVEDEFITSYSTGNYTVKSIDKVNRKTFPGAMRYAYEKLYELYPNAVFFITTPLQEAYENYLDIKAKGDLIDYIADRLSINTINSRRCGILNTYESPVGDINYDNPTGSESSRKRDLSDGIHTNPSGAKKLGEFNAREIIKYFCF